MIGDRRLGAAVRLSELVAVAACAFAGYDYLVALQPSFGDLKGDAVWLGPPLLCFSIAAGFLAAFLGRKRWAAACWSVRGALLFLGYLGWCYRGLARWQEILVWIALVIVGVVAHQITHRLALGWTIDPQTGERCKVAGFNRGHVVIVPTTYQQRVLEEHSKRSGRRKKLLWLGLVGWPLAYLALRLSDAHNIFAAFAAGLYAAMFLLPWCWELLVEAIYLTGCPLVPGAKVLDPPPPARGLQTVMSQQAFGRAGLASEAEAIELFQSLTGGRS